MPEKVKLKQFPRLTTSCLNFGNAGVGRIARLSNTLELCSAGMGEIEIFPLSALLN
jgi:hypothetical protein